MVRLGPGQLANHANLDVDVFGPQRPRFLDVESSDAGKGRLGYRFACGTVADQHALASGLFRVQCWVRLTFGQPVEEIFGQELGEEWM